eukprot:gene17079-18664_t
MAVAALPAGEAPAELVATGLDDAAAAAALPGAPAALAALRRTPAA